jgi:endonuclease YncB( thermonuclease family)
LLEKGYHTIRPRASHGAIWPTVACGAEHPFTGFGNALIIRNVSDIRIEQGYCARWLAGDIVEIDIAEGDEVYRRSIHRVFGMNAPEPSGTTLDVGLQCQRRAEEITRGKTLRFAFVVVPDAFLLPPRFKQYGRHLVRIFFDDNVDFAEQMIEEGLAVPYFMGMGKQPNPLTAKPQSRKKKSSSPLARSPQSP